MVVVSSQVTAKPVKYASMISSIPPFQRNFTIRPSITIAPTIQMLGRIHPVSQSGYIGSVTPLTTGALVSQEGQPCSLTRYVKTALNAPPERGTGSLSASSVKYESNSASMMPTTTVYTV